MEWGGPRERSQRTGQGNQNQSDDGRTGLEGSCIREQYQVGVTENLYRVGGGTGYGTMGAP